MNTSVTSAVEVNEQVRAVVEVAESAAKNGTRTIAEKSTVAGRQRVLAQGNVFATKVIAAIEAIFTELAEQIVGLLKLVSGAEKITIVATDGQGTIVSNGKDVFLGWIDSDFRHYGTDVKGQPTVETDVQVFELIKNGTFAQIFGGFGENLDRLCLSQDQIMRFVRDHSKWLNQDGYANFFLFKVGDEYFVAGVFWYSDGQHEVRVSRFSGVNVWNAENRHRVVLPQL